MESRLQHCGWDIAISPENGGAILYCRYEGVDILRAYDGPRGDDFEIFKAGGFCMVPFSNRIAGGTFSYNGKSVSIRQTRPDFPNPIHGSGWVSQWQAESRSPETLILKYSYAPGNEGFDWPWAFEAVQTFKAGKNILTHSLSVTNRSDETMPAGLGFHPYFPDIETAVLTAGADGVWQADDSGLPRDLQRVPPAWDFKSGRALDGTGIDNCFVGAGREAIITRDKSNFKLLLESSENLKFAVIYTAAGDGSFCYEPVTHMNNAVNFDGRIAETGLKDLPAGDTFTASMQYIVQL